MFRRLAAFLCVLLLASAAPAAGPDDQFIVIYNLIQQADKSPDKLQSFRLYTEAQEGLKKLQRGYPAWNERVINYRLHYCSDKLAGLQEVADQATRKPVLLNPIPEAPPNEVLTQLNDLNSRIQTLASDKQLLEARLREALSAQPAPIDPRELQAAVEKISALQSTNVTLLARIAAQETERKNLVDKVVAEEAQKALVETRRQLAEQKQAATRLERERTEVETRLKRIQDESLKPLQLQNQTLKDQVTELKSETEKGKQVAELSARLTKVQTGLDEMKRTNERLTLEKGALEKQVEDLKIRQAEEGIVKIAKLETELAVARADVERNTLRADELVATLTLEKQARTQLEHDNQTLEQRVSKLTARSEADSEALKNLQASLAVEKAEHAGVQAQLRAAEIRLQSVGGKPPDAATAVTLEQETQARAAQAEVARLRESLQQSTQREAELQTALTQESSLRTRLEREKFDLEHQLVDAGAALRAQSVGNPKATAPATRTLETKVLQLERERDELKGRLAALSQRATRRVAELRSRPAVTPRDRAAEFRMIRGT